MNMRPLPRLERERERVAQPERPDRPVLAGRGCEERVVGRDRAVGVDAQDLAEQVRQRLRVAPFAFSPTRDVQLAVGPEVQRAAVVVGRTAEVVQIEEDRLAARHRDVAVRRESADAVVDGGCSGRVVDVDVVIGREVGIEGESEQAALARGD